jgi:hypothetical protein
MGTFTQKHFVAIAATMYHERPEEPRAYWQWRLTIGALAQMFARANPRFDAERFMRACGAPGAE